MNTPLGYTVFIIHDEGDFESPCLNVGSGCLEMFTKEEAVEHALKLVRNQFEYESRDKLWLDPETGKNYSWQINPHFISKENPRYAADLVRRESAIRNLKSVDLDEFSQLMIMPIVRKEEN